MPKVLGRAAVSPAGGRQLNLPSCERKAAQANAIRYFQTFNQVQANVIRYFQVFVTYLFVVFVQQRDFHKIIVKPAENNQKSLSWLLLGRSWGHFWPLLAALGPLLAALGPLLAALGALLAALGALLGRSWPLLTALGPLLG